jgi:hypothetical protein
LAKILVVHDAITVNLELEGLNLESTLLAKETPYNHSGKP